MTRGEPEMMTPEERYKRDADFHNLVNLIYGWIAKCRYTPTEVREAAMLAAVRYSMDTDILRIEGHRWMKS